LIIKAILRAVWWVFKSAVAWAWTHPVAAILTSSLLHVGAYALDKYGGRVGEILATILHPFVWAFTIGCAGTAAIKLTKDLLFGAGLHLMEAAGAVQSVKVLSRPWWTPGMPYVW
jgi:hypothetical protein